MYQSTLIINIITVAYKHNIYIENYISTPLESVIGHSGKILCFFSSLDGVLSISFHVLINNFLFFGLKYFFLSVILSRSGHSDLKCPSFLHS